MSKQIFSNGHALVVGVSAYSPYAQNLDCTLDDAEGLADILKDAERCAYPPEQVSLLTDEKANRAGILTALDKLAKDADSDSTAVIYFSGHGGSKDGVYYLCPHGYNPANLAATTVSGQEFTEKIAAIPAKKKLILLDCCHAGGIGGGIKGEPLVKAPVPPEAIELFKQGKGCMIIAYSTPDEVSYTGKPYSVFTGALLEVLCGQGVAKKDGYVRVSDLVMYTARRTPQLTEDKQHPDLHYKQADNFVLAYYASGEKTPKTLPFTLQADVAGQAEAAEQEDTLAEAVKAIEELYVNARYDQAYARFHQLCDDYPDYQRQAAAILTRFRDFQNQIISGILPMQQQGTVNRQIGDAFQTCLQQFKQEHRA